MAVTAIGALVEGFNNGIQMINANAQAEEQRRENREILGIQQNFSEHQADVAYNRMLSMYNQYQSPAAIKAQLQAAGLSPALYYAGQAGAGGRMSAAPQGDTPSALNNQLPLLGLNSLTAGMANLANAELTKSQSRLNNANANNIEQKTSGEVALLNENIENLKEQRNLIIAQTEQAAATAKNQTAMAEYNNTLQQLANIDLITREDLNNLQVSELEEKIHNLQIQGEKAGLEKELLEETLETQIKIWAEQLNKLIAEQKLLGNQATYYNELSQGIKHENDVQKGIDKMLDAIIDNMDEIGNDAENRGKMKVIIKFLKTMVKLAAVYIKSNRTKK